MRLLAVLAALGLVAGAAPASAACTGMHTAGKDHVVASSSGKTQSTPIPARQDDDS
jgi:hypothetical protein